MCNARLWELNGVSSAILAGPVVRDSPNPALYGPVCVFERAISSARMIEIVFLRRGLIEECGMSCICVCACASVRVSYR